MASLVRAPSEGGTIVATITEYISSQGNLALVSKGPDLPYLLLPREFEEFEVKFSDLIRWTGSQKGVQHQVLVDHQGSWIFVLVRIVLENMLRDVSSTIVDLFVPCCSNSEVLLYL